MSGDYYERKYCPICHKWRAVLLPFGPKTTLRVCDECGCNWRNDFLPDDTLITHTAKP